MNQKQTKKFRKENSMGYITKEEAIDKILSGADNTLLIIWSALYLHRNSDRILQKRLKDVGCKLIIKEVSCSQ